MLLNVLGSLVLAAAVATTFFALHALCVRKLRLGLLWAVVAAASTTACAFLVDDFHLSGSSFAAACLFTFFLWRLRFSARPDRPIPRVSKRAPRTQRA